jgi:protein involved in polysaccharide export with SLBB domain
MIRFRLLKFAGRMSIVSSAFAPVLIFPLFMALLWSGAAGQDIESKIKEAAGTQEIPARITAPAGPGVLLEERIDPDTYVLGPGDKLSIFVWGNFQGQYQMSVSPEGVLLVPEVGPIDVSGITLRDSGQRISEAISRRYRNVKTVVSLVDLRSFKVYIGGAVTLPGSYPATPVSRVSEIVNLAGGFLLPEDMNMNFPSGPETLAKDIKISSKRNIMVYRRNGDSLKADLLRFEITGRTTFDPPLQEGDRIFVPLRENRINLYGIFGAVRNPGYFEYASSDSLADLIDLAHGLKMNADSENVEIVRFGPDNQKTFNERVDMKGGEWNVALRPDDRVFIKEKQDYHEKYQVLLTGEFLYPGYYAIRSDSTMLSEIVEQAGGFTEVASLPEAEMTRVSAEEVIDPEYERLRRMQVADMTESEYDYFKIKSRSKPGRVAVDFIGLFVQGDTSKDFVLRDGDVINVPRKSKVISVIGEVANPGLLPYDPIADFRDYITRAGGFSDRARKGDVSIIKGVSREWKDARKGLPLEPGDTVWIPEKKKKDYWGFIKDTLAFVGNLATVYLVIQQATE